LSTVVVLVAMTVGSLVVLEAFERRLLSNLDTTLEQQVADRVQLLEARADFDALTSVSGDEAFVWIGSLSGEVLSQGGESYPVDSPVPAVVGVPVTEDLVVAEHEDGGLEREQQTIRLVSGVAGDDVVVVVGAELEAIDTALKDLAGLFLFVVPAVTALVGALSWITAGRALAPVTAIRARAEEIGGSTLSDRVPVPDSDDEIHRLALTVNAMLDRIEKHAVAIRQFSSDASHELKSPLANIKALVETRRSSDPTWPSTKSQLVGEVDRLGALVENLLFLSTRQDGDRTAATESVQLDELLFAEAELVTAASDVRVSFGVVEPVAVNGVAADLSRLVRNLVDNAVRHAQSRIELGVYVDDVGVVLSVADDGPGVAERDRERIFERFARLDEARARDDGGTGLGLSIAKQVADAHDARIAVGDAEIGGAIFTITFAAENS